MTRVLWLGAVVAALLLTADFAAAHRVNVFAWVEGDAVRVESEFNRGNPVKGGAVAVYGADAADPFLTGVTDAAGAFRFAIPMNLQENPVDMRIEVAAGQGHLGAWTVRAAEYAAAPTGPDETSAPPAAARNAPSAAGVVTQDAAAQAALAEAVATAVAAELEPHLTQRLSALTREVASLKESQGPGLRDVLGGVGYLLGLAGLAAYVQSRRRR